MPAQSGKKSEVEEHLYDGLQLVKARHIDSIDQCANSVNYGQGIYIVAGKSRVQREKVDSADQQTET